MGLTRTYVGKHPDTGAPYYHYLNDDPSKSVLVTGPATGDLTVSDGTVYNVDPEVILCASLDHAEELGHHLIGLQHEETGRYDVVNDDGELVRFKHQACRFCDDKDAK